MYLAGRRFFFDKAASVLPLFGYYFTEFIPGNDLSRGGEWQRLMHMLCFALNRLNHLIVAHGSELPLIFGPGPTPVEDEFANTLTDYYINFVHDLHPGGVWPQYSESRHLLQLKRDNLSMIPDGKCCCYHYVGIVC